MKSERIIITAALPYANGKLHIGHLLEYIQADIYTRFLKLLGQDALYICASDMHGTPIEVNAKKAGKEPEQFALGFWKEHQQEFAAYLIKFDNYYKTHSPENKELAEYFFAELKRKKLIYTKKIKVVYCEKCKRSLPDRFVKGKCPHCKAEEQYGDVCEKCGSVIKGIDLLEPYCIICHNRPIKKDSEHYFFKLSSFAKKLAQWFDSKEADLQPEVKNWLKGWLENLEDWCVSRDAPYFGFEIPDSKKETGEIKYFYVWLDAPIGYISSTKNYCDRKRLDWKDYWYKGKVQHFIGKDIAYFHYLFWPAMLMGVGIPTPKLTTHGWVTVNGQKMSKSRGTFFTAEDFRKTYPTEPLRFYFASYLDRKVIDVDMNLNEFQAVTNNVLMGNLGNFCYRTLTFAEKNYGTIAKIKGEKALVKKIEGLLALIRQNYQEQDFKSAVRHILQIADLGNSYFQQAEPWKEKEKKQAEVGFCVNLARNLAIIASPILPKFSQKIYASLNFGKEQKPSWNDLGWKWKGKLNKIDLLVKKIEHIPELEPKETEQKKELKASTGTKKETQKTLNNNSKNAKTANTATGINIEIRVGKIVEVKDHPNADSLYLLKVDFGAEKRQVVAGLKAKVPAQELLNRVTVFCANLKKAKLRGEMSEAMILVADDGQKIAFLDVEKAKSKLGEAISPAGTSIGHIASHKEISFDEFKQLKIIVKKGLVTVNDKVLPGVSVKGMKDGVEIR